MKYVLLAFGILFAVAGAYSIYTGYGIIEDDRGSASVIAGATVLTGGMLIVALSFVIGSLDRLKATQETHAAHPVPAEFAHPLAPKTLLATEDVPAQQREEPLFDAVDRARAAPLPEPPPAPATAPPAPRAPEPVIKGLSRASSAFITAAARARDERRGEPSINDLWRRVGVNLDASKPGKTAEIPARNTIQPEPSQAASSDWLDEGLADFEDAIAAKSPEPREEAPPLAPNVPPEQPQPEVIGRYEAEGTTYVMYADGSIDAQTEEGVLRFKSMAELQAFFEG
jgi:hypothetical protein